MEAVAARGINRRTSFELDASLVARFWAKVAVAGEDDCWNWTAATRDGYGAIGGSKGRDRKTLGAHVVSFRIHHGPVPIGSNVLHSCDNRLCCNPKHLSAGTQKQNVDEMFARERRVMRGEKGTNATITEHDALLVKAARIATGFGWMRLSRLLPTSPKIIKHIVENYRWTHIPWPSKDEARRLLADAGIEVAT